MFISHSDVWEPVSSLMLWCTNVPNLQLHCTQFISYKMYQRYQKYNYSMNFLVEIFMWSGIPMLGSYQRSIKSSFFLFSWSQPSICVFPQSLHPSVSLSPSVSVCLPPNLPVLSLFPALSSPLLRHTGIGLTSLAVECRTSLVAAFSLTVFPSPLSHWPPDGAPFAWLGKQLGSITGQALVPCQYKCQQ